MPLATTRLAGAREAREVVVSAKARVHSKATFVDESLARVAADWRIACGTRVEAAAVGTADDSQALLFDAVAVVFAVLRLANNYISSAKTWGRTKNKWMRA